MRTRAIPRTGEPLPCIGLGTWRTFDVGEAPSERAPLAEVLRVLREGGGRLIDSSPMYGRAEAVVGELVRAQPEPRPFLATKVWTTGREAGLAQLEESERRMAAPGRLDLVQVHNLLDLDVQLATLREWKASGRIRYVGATHHASSGLDRLAALAEDGAVDFVQVPYSVAVRDAEARLLGAARDGGVAVLVMRPLESGDLAARLRAEPLPAFAAELGCSTWPQLLLKWILGHPAVTCVIPATADPRHAADNVRAGEGPLPDEELRRRILAVVRAV